MKLIYKPTFHYSILTLFTLAICSSCKTQSRSFYSQYMYNMLAINPAYAGNRQVTGVNSYYRRQWMGLDGAPKSASISIDGTLMENKIGIGAQFYNDQLGVESSTGFNGMISSRIKLNEKAILSVGLSAGLMDYQANLSGVTNLVNTNDPAFQKNFTKIIPQIGAGIYYNTDNFYLGASVPNFLKSGLNNYQSADSFNQTLNNYQVFISTGFQFPLDDNIYIKPSTMVWLSSGAKILYDLNINVWIKNILGFGFSYRNNGIGVGIIELQITQQFKLGYSYEFPISNVSGNNYTSDDFLLRYEFGGDIKPVKSLRYF